MANLSIYDAFKRYSFMTSIVHVTSPDDLKPFLEKKALEAIAEKFTKVNFLLKCQGFITGIDESQPYHKYDQVYLTQNETRRIQQRSATPRFSHDLLKTSNGVL
jgi:hypothetical protein